MSQFEIPTFKRAFFTGLLALAPVGITIWVFVALFRLIDGWIQPLLQRIPAVARLIPESGIPGIGFLTAILVVVVVGFFANNLLGRWFFGFIDQGLARIPWIKPVYSAAKDLSGVLFGGRSRAFRDVVVFEYPRKGIVSLGFVTADPEHGAEDGYYHVFLPTTPNPTSGFFLMVPERDAIPLGIPIEDGLKLVVSGGAVLAEPHRRRLAQVLTQLNAREG